MRKCFLILLLFFNILIASGGSGGCSSPLLLPSYTLTVASLNMYVGFDITPFLDGSVDLNDPTAVANAANQIISEYEANEPETRLAAMADAIIDADADIVGLQEALIWIRNGVAQDNFVDELIELLEQKSGTKYNSLTLTTFTVTIPLGGSDTLTYADREAIIFKEEVYCQAATDGIIFDTARAPITVLGNQVTFTRGAISAECLLPNILFVYIFSTHLEGSDLPSVQEGQASELIDYIAQTATYGDIPTFLLGDFNALESGGNTNTYSIITDAGFGDTYRTIYPDATQNPGYTCCQPADLSNSTSQADRRVDYVFYRGEEFSIDDSSVFANQTVPRQMSSGTIWPSDHFGVTGTFTLP